MKKEEGFYIEERRKSPQRSMVYRNQCSRGVYSFIKRNINWMDDRNTDCRLLPRHDTAGMLMMAPDQKGINRRWLALGR